MRSVRTQVILGLGALLLAAAPVLAQPPQPPCCPDPYASQQQHRDNFGEFRLWAGEFFPTAHGSYWDNNFATFTGSRTDFQDVIGGGDFILHLDRYNALVFSASFYSGSDTEAYRNLADQNNNGIFHNTSLDIDSGSVAYALFPAGTHNAVIPYIGAGVGIFGWRLHEGGNFVDPNNNIFGAGFVNSGTAFGGLLLAGLEVPVTRHVAFLVDGRYTMAHANLGGEFAGFGRLDLSGAQVVGGVAFHL
jgi:hypothetical protein